MISQNKKIIKNQDKKTIEIIKGDLTELIEKTKDFKAINMMIELLFSHLKEEGSCFDFMSLKFIYRLNI